MPNRDPNPITTEALETHRGRLESLAHRILGSRTNAEDVVLDKGAKEITISTVWAENEGQSNAPSPPTR